MTFFTAQEKVGQDQAHLRLERNLKFWGWSVHAYITNWWVACSTGWTRCRRAPPHSRNWGTYLMGVGTHYLPLTCGYRSAASSILYHLAVQDRLGNRKEQPNPGHDVSLSIHRFQPHSSVAVLGCR